jgi:predicted porin
MKFKTTAIALAVAGTVAAPVAVQAGEGEVYASARIGIQMTDTGGTSDFDIRSFSSRFGAKGESDLGNGLTGYGHYEWDVDFGDENGDSEISVRHRYVGLKGDFGRVYIGQTYHAFYNHVVGPADPAYWNSGFAMIEYRGRTDDTITYARDGAVSFAVSAVLIADPEEETPDAIEAGLSFGIGDTKLGFGVISPTEDGAQPAVGNVADEDVFGVMWSGINLGSVGLAFGAQSQDEDVGFNFAVTAGGLYVVGEFEDMDEADQSPGGVTVGYEQTLGTNTKMWYEIHSFDADTGDSDDDKTHIAAVLRYDIL